jgi:DNA polymerase I
MVTKESKNGREIFVILDANSIVHRAFHSFPPTLETSKGIQVNAAFGFTSMFLKVLELFDPKYIACAFDTAKPTFRHTIYSDYKATRKPTDQSLIDQFPIVEDIVRSFNIPILKKEGYEADDIIGTIAEYVERGRWSESNVHLCIVSSDNDLLQLVNENVSVILPQGNFKNLKEFMREEVYEKLSVYPEQVVDYKALVGDPSDNIPGVKGIGCKTAADLIARYGSLDGVYSNLDDLKPRVRNLLEEGSEQAGFSKELATIAKDVDLKVGLEDCLEKDFDYNKVVEKFVHLEFRSLIKKIPKSIDSRNEQKYSEQDQISLFKVDAVEQGSNFDSKEFKLALEGAKKLFILFLDSEETSFKKRTLLVRCIANEQKDFMISGDDVVESFKVVSQILMNKDVSETLFYNLEGFLGSLDISSSKKVLPFVEKILEAKFLAHIESSSRKDYSFSNLCFEYLSKHVPDPLNFDEYPKYFEYLENILSKIKDELKSRSINKNIVKTGKNFLSFCAETENVLSITLDSMEKRGILMDTKLLKKLYSDLEDEINSLIQGIYYDIGHEFNINSTQQLADVLFNELGLEPTKKTKTSFSTSEEVLKQLEGAHPAVSKILEYRRKTKVMNTYVKYYFEEVEDGVVHTDFKQTGTTSGRLSSINPNMQNLPSGSDLSDRLREIFVPREGFVFVSTDYSQIDLRIMAHLSEDENLIEAFEEGKDIHLSTAAKILSKEEAQISASERRMGKTINFGIIYGLTSFGLSDSLKIPVPDAKEYIEEYFGNYSGVAEYIDRVTKEVQNIGYVETILGRRRYVPGVNSRNIRVKNAAIREAINMPIQGGSADIMKLAMLEIYRLISKKYEDKAFMLLQIHDEIIFEVKKSEVSDFEEDIKEVMESIVNLKVPLSVHVSDGNNMSELK